MKFTTSHLASTAIVGALLFAAPAAHAAVAKPPSCDDPSVVMELADQIAYAVASDIEQLKDTTFDHEVVIRQARMDNPS